MGNARTHIVGYAGAEHSGRALERAVALAAALGAELVVAHVRDDVSSPHHAGIGRAEEVTPDADLPMQATKAADSTATDPVAQAHEALDPLRGDHEIVELDGDVADALIELARDRRAQLIVLGVHDRSLLERLLSDSVSESVARDAPCDVLIVR